MSVHETRTGRWEVRWREGTRNLSPTSTTKTAARSCDPERRRQSHLGVHGTPDASAMRLGQWLRHWWDLEAPGWRRSRHLPRASHLDKRIVPSLRQVQLRDLGAVRVAEWRSEILQAGMHREAGQTNACGPSARRWERPSRTGCKVLQVSARLGHEPATTTLNHYAHIFDESRGGERIPMADAVAAGRRMFRAGTVADLDAVRMRRKTA